MSYELLIEPSDQEPAAQIADLCRRAEALLLDQQDQPRADRVRQRADKSVRSPQPRSVNRPLAGESATYDGLRSPSIRLSIPRWGGRLSCRTDAYVRSLGPRGPSYDGAPAQA